MVAVALSALSYTFFIGIFASVRASGTEAIERAATAGQAMMKIESVSGNQVFIRNVGQVNLSNFEVYVGDTPVDYTIDNPTLSPGDVATVSFTSAPAGDIRVTTGEGALSIYNNYLGYYDAPPTSFWIWENPASPTYSPGATYRFNVTINDDKDISTVLFQWGTSSNVSVTTYVIHNATARNYTTTKTDLSGATTYSYKWFANDSLNQWTNISDSYTINRASTTTSLFLNGSTTNRSYTRYQYANFTVTVNVAGKTVQLYTNLTGSSTLWAQGATPLVNLTNLTYSIANFYNITGAFSTDQNYSGSSKTLFANIT